MSASRRWPGSWRRRSGAPGVGGSLLFVEATRIPGRGALTLTGGQGDAVLYSARAALSWLQAHAAQHGIDPGFRRHTDVHLHVQADASLKDGASAGVAMAAALVSTFTGRPVRAGLAMTGEITLSGQVLPVGAIPAKVLTAHRGGLARRRPCFLPQVPLAAGRLPPTGRPRPASARPASAPSARSPATRDAACRSRDRGRSRSWSARATAVDNRPSGRHLRPRVSRRRVAPPQHRTSSRQAALAGAVTLDAGRERGPWALASGEAATAFSGRERWVPRPDPLHVDRAERARHHAGRCTGAGCSRASAMPRSNSASRSAAYRSTSRRQPDDLRDEHHLGGVNYVVPVDARLERDVDVRYETVTLDDLLVSTAAALPLVLGRTPRPRRSSPLVPFRSPAGT